MQLPYTPLTRLTLPQLLRRIRRIEDLTQMQLATRSGIPYWRIRRIEDGMGRVRPHEMKALIGALPVLQQVFQDKNRG